MYDGERQVIKTFMVQTSKGDLYKSMPRRKLSDQILDTRQIVISLQDFNILWM